MDREELFEVLAEAEEQAGGILACNPDFLNAEYLDENVLKDIITVPDHVKTTEDFRKWLNGEFVPSSDGTQTKREGGDAL